MAITYNRTNRSEHAWIDHVSRMALIEEYLGFTNIVIEIIEKRKDGRITRKGLTSSGVIVVRCLNEDKIITAFMAHDYQAEGICRKAGKKCVPPKLMEKIKKNAKRHPELFYA
jgi:hypothetical protein